MAAYWKSKSKLFFSTGFRISISSACIFALLEPSVSFASQYTKKIVNSEGSKEKNIEEERIIGRSQDCDWIEAASEEGFLYEYNRNTGESRWKTPYKWRKNWDFRAETPSKSRVVHQIVLIRHGQYTAEHSTDGRSAKSMRFSFVLI